MENSTKETKPFICAECGNTTYTSGKLNSATGVGSFVPNRFLFISCLTCGYTKFYKVIEGIKNSAEILTGQQAVW